MKKINIIKSGLLIVITLVCGVNSQAQAATEPLDCTVKMMLAGLTAQHRDDRGVARQHAYIANAKNNELTQGEIKEILDRVYVLGVNQTVDQIKDDVYKTCQSTKR